MSNEQIVSGKAFCAYHQIEIHFLHSLNEYGLIEMEKENEDYFLLPEQLDVIEKMMRLHYDLHVNFEGIDVITHLLQQVKGLEKEIEITKKRLRFYESD